MRLNIYGIDIEVVRRRTRGVSMRIRPGTNAVSMSVPMRLPQKEIEEFAKKFIAKLAKRQGQSIEEFAGGLKQNRQYSDGEKILIWGKEYMVRIKKVRTPRDIFAAYAGKELPLDVLTERLKYDIPKIELKGSEALLYVPFCPPKIAIKIEEPAPHEEKIAEEPPAEELFLFDMSDFTKKEEKKPAEAAKRRNDKPKTIEKTVFVDNEDPNAEPSFSDRQYAFYFSIRKLLYEKIKEFLPKWEAKTGLKCKDWNIRNVNSYWGIYRHGSGQIDFNINLAHKPTECLEYIILHELAHSKQMNHGPKFKAILDKFMPDWRKTSQQLKKRGD
ncbi:MAG: M48 family metallopeptidase [Elusimicrobiales bacterium]|nr:M48 family metallopeptidase [Elusimicrobiales bacterium]